MAWQDIWCSVKQKFYHNQQIGQSGNECVQVKVQDQVMNEHIGNCIRLNLKVDWRIIS